MMSSLSINVLKARYMRYAAPVNFTIVNSIADVCRITDRPKAAQNRWKETPVVVPNAAAMLAFDPRVRPFDTTKIMAGPGINMTAIDVTMKRAKFEISIGCVSF